MKRHECAKAKNTKDKTISGPMTRNWRDSVRLLRRTEKRHHIGVKLDSAFSAGNHFRNSSSYIEGQSHANVLGLALALHIRRTNAIRICIYPGRADPGFVLVQIPLMIPDVCSMVATFTCTSKYSVLSYDCQQRILGLSWLGFLFASFAYIWLGIYVCGGKYVK